MGSSFAVPYGERDGKLIHVSEAERGLRCGCCCPVCREPLVARKGAKQSHHFAHRGNLSCSGETVLHELGKRLLHRRLADAIANGLPVEITWKCDQCFDQHRGNLTKKAARSQLECSLGPCRPDLVLFDGLGSPITIVEVVVHHKPDENVIDYATAREIPIAEFHLKSADDLEALVQQTPLRVSKASLCTRRKCPRCGTPLLERRLHVVVDDCYNCHKPMKFALLNIEGSTKGPEAFSGREIENAREQGAKLQVRYSRTQESRYLANVCTRCDAFVGQYYLHEYMHLLDDSVGIATGYFCWRCEEADAEDDDG